MTPHEPIHGEYNPPEDRVEEPKEDASGGRRERREKQESRLQKEQMKEIKEEKRNEMKEIQENLKVKHAIQHMLELDGEGLELDTKLEKESDMVDLKLEKEQHIYIIEQNMQYNKLVEK